jgi:hypothetical protein
MVDSIVVPAVLEIVKILTRDTIRPSGHPTNVRTQVHKLHIAESVDDVVRRPTSRIEPLSNIVNSIEIRQSFVVVDVPIPRKGEIELHKSCRFVGIENAYGEMLSESDYEVEITRPPGSAHRIRIDPKQLLKKRAQTFCVVSRTDDEGIFNHFLRKQMLVNGNFKVTPQSVTLQNGVPSQVEYRGGCLYDRRFIGTRYEAYCNLDDPDRTILYSLDCAIDLFEIEWIYHLDDPAESEPQQPRRACRVYGLGQLASKSGIILTESGGLRKKLPKWDLKRARVDVKIYGEAPALPAGQEGSDRDQ